MKEKNKNPLPIGFGMALAQNTEAMQRFDKLSADDKAKYIDRARHASSKKEMEALVGELDRMGENLQ